MPHELLHGEEETVMVMVGIWALMSVRKQLFATKRAEKSSIKSINDHLRLKKLSKSGQHYAKTTKRMKLSVRSKVGRVFAVVKRLLGYQKTRY